MVIDLDVSEEIDDGVDDDDCGWCYLAWNQGK
jgi:hypothetical protein